MEIVASTVVPPSILSLILTSNHLINNLITFRKSYIAQSLSLREIVRKYLKMQSECNIFTNNVIIVNCFSDYHHLVKLYIIPEDLTDL